MAGGRTELENVAGESEFADVRTSLEREILSIWKWLNMKSPFHKIMKQYVIHRHIKQIVRFGIGQLNNNRSLLYAKNFSPG